VSAREEERRRLRRDLHDGLGPELASMTTAWSVGCTDGYLTFEVRYVAAVENP
jgi:signal transduction histidine kinase